MTADSLISRIARIFICVIRVNLRICGYIPLVVASERGGAQTFTVLEIVRRCLRIFLRRDLSRTGRCSMGVVRCTVGYLLGRTIVWSCIVEDPWNGAPKTVIVQ